MQRSAVGIASDSRARGPGFDTRSGQILSFPQLLAKVCHEVLVNRSAQEKCGEVTNRPRCQPIIKTPRRRFLGAMLLLLKESGVVYFISFKDLSLLECLIVFI